MNMDSLKYMQIKLFLKRILTGYQFEVRLAFSTLIFAKECSKE